MMREQFDLFLCVCVGGDVICVLVNVEQCVLVRVF